MQLGEATANNSPKIDCSSTELFLAAAWSLTVAVSTDAVSSGGFFLALVGI
jgi:hypothetical protein